jgi:hypothetical protein
VAHIGARDETFSASPRELRKVFAMAEPPLPAREPRALLGFEFVGIRGNSWL